MRISSLLFILLVSHLGYGSHGLSEGDAVTSRDDVKESVDEALFDGKSVAEIDEKRPSLPSFLRNKDGKTRNEDEESVTERPPEPPTGARDEKAAAAFREKRPYLRPPSSPTAGVVTALKVDEDEAHQKSRELYTPWSCECDGWWFYSRGYWYRWGYWSDCTAYQPQCTGGNAGPGTIKQAYWYWDPYWGYWYYQHGHWYFWGY